jgi:hypothetical protein
MKQKFRLQLLFALIAFIFSAQADLFSQGKSQKSAVKSLPAKADVIPLDTAVRVGKLANGFTYYIRKNIEPKNRVTLYPRE